MFTLTVSIVIALAVLGNSYPTKKNDTDSYYWSWAQGNQIECPDPVPSGLTYGKVPTYVGRIRIGKNVYPGFVEPKKVLGAVSPNKDESVISKVYEVLCGNGIAWEWYNNNGDQIFPKNAIQTGEDDGKPLYSCRAPVLGSYGNFVSGNLNLEDGNCYLLQTGSDYLYNMETKASMFEVLVEAPKEVPVIRAIGKSVQNYRWEWASESYLKCQDIITPGLEVKSYENNIIYAARTHHNDKLVPGMRNATTNHYIVDKKIYEASNYEVLCGTNVAWALINTTAQEIPKSAIPVGYENDGEVPLYMCKIIISGTQASIPIGHVDSVTKNCTVATMDEKFNYNVITTSNKFEVLIST